jgi:hypothetical protein
VLNCTSLLSGREATLNESHHAERRNWGYVISIGVALTDVVATCCKATTCHRWRPGPASNRIRSGICSVLTKPARQPLRRRASFIPRKGRKGKSGAGQEPFWLTWQVFGDPNSPIRLLARSWPFFFTGAAASPFLYTPVNHGPPLINGCSVVAKFTIPGRETRCVRDLEENFKVRQVDFHL